MSSPLHMHWWPPHAYRHGKNGGNGPWPHGAANRDRSCGDRCRLRCSVAARTLLPRAASLSLRRNPPLHTYVMISNVITLYTLHQSVWLSQVSKLTRLPKADFELRDGRRNDLNEGPAMGTWCVPPWLKVTILCTCKMKKCPPYRDVYM